jgi:pyruvate dehydrogenase E2 component (dihydrolipoamide acetyltransferase)
VDQLKDVLLPDIGDIATAEVVEILVAVGERIVHEQSLLTLETDKASVEIPAPVSGVVHQICVKLGDQIGAGTLIMTVSDQDHSARPEPSAAPMMDSDDVPARLITDEKTPDKATPVRSADQEQSDHEAALVTIRLPDIGDFHDIPVVEILVQSGDTVAIDQSLLTLESDKATMEIPAAQAGVIQDILVQVGDRINQGDALLTLKPTASVLMNTEELVHSAAEEVEFAQAPNAATKISEDNAVPGEAPWRKAPVLPRPADMASIAHGRIPHASPSVRRFARELGVDLGQVRGSARKGRILKEDVQAFVKRALASGSRGDSAPSGWPAQLFASPEIDFSKFGPIDVQPLSRIKRLSGQHLQRCWVSIPHVTQFDDVDITALDEFRQQHNANATPETKLTLMPFVLKAVAGALEQMPILKASLAPDAEHLVYKQYCHLGVAVDTPNGLLVPVIRDVHEKGLQTLAHELRALSVKARTGKLLPGDMQGGVFSISSLGGIGGRAFTPIVNAPEVAILGLSRATYQPVWDGNQFVPRLLLPLALSYDHRVVDGADGARFITCVGQLLADIRRLLL